MSDRFSKYGNEMAGVLENLHGICWSMEANGMSEDIRYTKEDVMHAMKIFSHVLMNRVIHDRLDAGQTADKHVDEVQQMGEELHTLLMKYTGIDSHQFYKTT